MPRRWISSLAILSAIFLNGGLRIINVWLSPTGRVLNIPINVIWIAQVALVILFVLLFIFRSTQGADFTDQQKTRYTVASLYLLFGLISIPVGRMIANPIQQRGYEAFLLENQFLIEAIESFEATHGRPPDSLEALYPEQLDPPLAEIIQEQIGDEFVPKLNLSVPYQSIDRTSAESVLYDLRPAAENDPWQLQVSIYLGSFQSVRFVYNPEESYSNRFEPIKEWGLRK